MPPARGSGRASRRLWRGMPPGGTHLGLPGRAVAQPLHQFQTVTSCPPVTRRFAMRLAITPRPGKAIRTMNLAPGLADRSAEAVRPVQVAIDHRHADRLDVDRSGALTCHAISGPRRAGMCQSGIGRCVGSRVAVPKQQPSRRRSPMSRGAEPLLNVLDTRKVTPPGRSKSEGAKGSVTNGKRRRVVCDVWSSDL